MSVAPRVAPAPEARAFPTFARLLGEFDRTTLAQLDAVSLLNRVDTKYVLSAAQLSAILPSLADEYLALDIGGRRLHQYRTQYFDTLALALYRQHHQGQPDRLKVRSRAYVESRNAFFEIKAKSVSGRTIKTRISTPELLEAMTPDAAALLADRLSAAQQRLLPTVRNDFYRVTLVGRHTAERLTLDLGVQFGYAGRTAVLPGLAIAELKQSRFDERSPFVRRMLHAGLQPTSVSKYCIGVALLVPEVEHQAFTPNLHAIQEITRSAPEVW